MSEKGSFGRTCLVYPNNQPPSQARPQERTLKNEQNVKLAVPWETFLGPKPGPTVFTEDVAASTIFGEVGKLWIKNWMKFTNNNALTVIGAEWKPIELEETAAYFSILLTMSIKRLPEVRLRRQQSTLNMNRHTTEQH